MIEQAYFKQYSCYNYKFTKQIDESNDLDLHINFSESKNLDVDILPSVLIDKMSNKQQLYLLDYKTQSDHQLLYIKDLNQQKWKMIKMNYLPQIITISGGTIYMIAGRSLSICSLYQKHKEIRTLLQGKIISANPCAVQFENNKGQHYQPGISVTYFTESQGYSFKQYSIHNKQGEKTSLSKIVNLLLFKKFIQFRHFQIIVPNLIALVFLSESEFCLFNIQVGMIEESTKTKLIYSRLGKDEKPVIKWSQHIKVGNFDKSLIFTIGINSGIESFVLHMKYLPNFQTQLANTKLQDIHSGNFIDWDSIIIVAHLYLHASANIVIDMAISNRGIVYYSKDELNSQIGSCSYVDFNSTFIESPILTQQALVWKKYYEDRDLQMLTDKNRFFIPNRYPLQLVQQHQDTRGDQLRPILLNQWRAHYKFKHILIYNEQMIIARGGSLSILRAIQEQSYHYEHFSQEKLSLLDHLQKNKVKINREVENIFTKHESEFQESIFNGFSDRPIFQQRSYKKILQNDANNRQEQAQKKLQAKIGKLLMQFQIINTQSIKKEYQNLKITQFRFPLTSSILYDYLNYYHLILHSKKSKVPKEELQQKTKSYQVYLCVTKLISYYYDLLQRSQQQYNYFDNNFIALFIDSKKDKLTSDIDASVYSYFKLMFQHLFPLNFNYFKHSFIEETFDQELTQNSYVEFIIGLLMDSLDEEGVKEESSKSRYLRDQLFVILKIGFFDTKSNSFAAFWNNTSLFKALLLCNDQPYLESVFDQFLLKKDSSRFLHIYKEIRRYIKHNHIVAIQNILLLNQKFHYLEPDLFYATTATSQVKSEIIGLIKKDIYNENLLNWNTNKANLNCQIISEIKLLGLLQQFDQNCLMNIKKRLNMVQFNHDEQQLQFYEQVIAAFIQLFNSKIKIQGWEHQFQNLDSTQYDILSKRKTQLAQYLQQIQRNLTNYKNLYTKIYQQNVFSVKDNQQKIPQIIKHYNFETTLLKKRFIDSPEKFYFFEPQRQLICSSISLTLIRQALEYSNQQSLQVIEDLVCFWLNWIKNYSLPWPTRSTTESTLYFEIVYLFDSQQVQKYLKFDNQLFDKMKRIYTRIQHQANYEFFSLFKEDYIQ